MISKIFSPLAKVIGKCIRNPTNHLKHEQRCYSTKFETKPYDLHKLDQGPATTAELTKEDGLRYYRMMILCRRMEKEINNLYQQKIARGFCHLYVGQEAICVGIQSMMLPQDTAITSYRCHAWTLLMDTSMESIFSEMVAGRSGCARGKGGSMHMFGHNIYGGHAIVGAYVPLGTGLALAHKYKGDGGTCVTIYGDGASDQGQVFEAMNQAKLLSLPVLYLIENNFYSMGTALARHTANTNLYSRSNAVPGLRMDGMDVLSVREGARFCFEHTRSGKGPIVLELITYRYFGHSMSDPGTSYRSREEIRNVRENKDPIKLLRDKILSASLATEKELHLIDKETKSKVEKALKRALIDKELKAEEVAYDIYCEYEGNIRLPGIGRYLPHRNAGVFPSCR